jgi:hypothetical protein
MKGMLGGCRRMRDQPKPSLAARQLCSCGFFKKPQAPSNGRKKSSASIEPGSDRTKNGSNSLKSTISAATLFASTPTPAPDDAANRTPSRVCE